jgi:membrane protein implicated in regulation of membrane protease activity
MNLETTATHWAVIGMALLLAEIMTQSFFFLFLGISGLLVAGFKFFGLSHFSGELILFAVTSLILIGALRKRALNRFTETKKTFQADENVLLIASADLEPGVSGTIEYQGVPWSALNASKTSIKKGDQIVILRTEGIQLIVHPKKGAPEAQIANDF